MTGSSHDDAAVREAIPRILQRAFPGHMLRSFSAMPGGLINGMYRIELEGLQDALVLRVYTRAPEACRKEVELHRLVAGRVPVPEILYESAVEDQGFAPHVVMRWVKGVTFRELKARRDAGEIAEAARCIGETLAHIAAFEFASAGRIDAGLTIGAPLLAGDHGAAVFVEDCLKSAAIQTRLDAAQRDRVRGYIWDWAPRLESLAGEHRLVHSDFGGPNLLMDDTGGHWHVSGVIDWEFAFSGPPIVDVGHMLRYERLDRPLLEPHFSEGYRAAGGTLPADWRGLSRAIDSMALCELLTRPELPERIVAELAELIAATTQEH